MAQKFPTIHSRNFSSGTQLDSAMYFAEHGIPVVPLYGTRDGHCTCFKGSECRSPGKHPMTKHGLKEASAELDVVEDWWMDTPTANLGLLTGETTGLVVLDVDPRHGGDQSLIELQEEFGPLPQTVRVKTGGDGEHYYFRHPGLQLRNKTNVREGLDIRGDGGYIVAPPSVHASKKPYLWDEQANELAQMPNWLLNLIQKRNSAPKKNLKAKTKSEPRAQSTLNEGSRNSSLLSLGGVLKSRGLTQEQVAAALNSLNTSLCHPPLEQFEVAQIAQSLAKYEEDPWGQPLLLPEETRAQTLTPDLLPNALSSWCTDIAERMQVPLECVAGPAIVMISSLIGRKVAIYPKRRDKWELVPNVWGMIVSPPGTLKTPTLNSVLKPLFDLDLKAQEQIDEAKAKFKEQEIVAKTEIDALKDSLKKAVREGKPEHVDQCKQQLEIAVRDLEEKSRLPEKRYTVNDPTTEKLLTIVVDNPQGVLVYRDELSGWLETMQKSGREGDRQFFLEAWNGDSPYKMDRIGRGTVSVEGLCLSVLGGLQPVVFDNYVASVVKGGKSDDGLLQRFQLLIYPERRKGWKRIDREPNEQAAQMVREIVAAIDAIPVPTRVEGVLQRLQLRYSSEAQDLADSWVEALERRLEGDRLAPIYEAHLGKFRSLMPSLATIFSIIDSFSSGRAEFPTQVDEASVRLAIQWCSFLESHAKRGYGQHLNPGHAAARHLLKKIQKKKVKDFDRPRDLYRKKWKGLSSADELEQALTTLSDYGWIRLETIRPDGKSIEVIRLHPSLRT